MRAFKEILSNGIGLLPNYISLLFPERNLKGVKVLVEALLLHQGILKINVLQDKSDEVVKCYIEKTVPEWNYNITTIKRCKMPKIPANILKQFSESSNSAEEKLMNWLLENNVEKLNCSYILSVLRLCHLERDPFPIIIKIANAIAKSSVHTVYFRNNYLAQNGPLVAAALTSKHSKVQVVDFSSNNLGQHAIAVATNLTGKHSKIKVVNLSDNHLAHYGPRVAIALTGKYSKVEVIDLSNNNLGFYSSFVASRLTNKQSKVHTVNFSDFGYVEDKNAVKNALTGIYSKIINVVGIELTDQEIKNNAINLLIQAAGISSDSSQELAVKAQYETINRNLSNGIGSLSAYITLLVFRRDLKGIKVLIKALLLHHNILKINDIIENKTDEVMERYIEVNCWRSEADIQTTAIAPTLTFSGVKRNFNGLTLAITEPADHSPLGVAEHAMSISTNYSCAMGPRW